MGHLKWFLAAGALYAARTVRSGPYTRLLYLHRVVANAPPGSEVDHANGNKLDNRAANLRVTTRSGNTVNKVFPTSKTGMRGVVATKDGRWEARVTVHYKLHRYGPFDDIESAARAYDDAARATHGAFARPNYPRPGERGARLPPVRLPA